VVVNYELSLKEVKRLSVDAVGFYCVLNVEIWKAGMLKLRPISEPLQQRGATYIYTYRTGASVIYESKTKKGSFMVPERKGCEGRANVQCTNWREQK
jgi:hypothetical protein